MNVSLRTCERSVKEDFLLKLVPAHPRSLLLFYAADYTSLDITSAAITKLCKYSECFRIIGIFYEFRSAECIGMIPVCIIHSSFISYSYSSVVT